MKNNTARRIEKRLMVGDVSEPPFELLEKLKADIPDLPVAAGGSEGRERITAVARRPALRLLAASVFLAVVGGVVAYRVMERTPMLSEAVFPDEAMGRTAESGHRSVDVAAAAPEALGREEPEVAIREDAESPSKQTSSDPAVKSRAMVETQVPVDERKKDEGALFASVTDTQGQELSGVIVTVGGVGGDQSQVTGSEGQVRWPAISSGDYELRAELEGFSTVEYPNIVISGDRGTAVEITLSAAVQEVVTVTSESPLLDERKLSAGTTVSQVKLEKIPTAREPWSVRTQTPGAQSDRLNVGPTGSPSTGGTHEPNDAPYGDMFFRSYGVNPFIDTEDDRFSTFGLDVDTGSYTVARSYLQRGHLPPSEAIRVEEFLNFFDFGDPAPRESDFGLTVDGAPSPFAEGPRYKLLRFGLAAREVDALERPAADLVFVIDVSGSMERENRLNLVRQSLNLLLDELLEGDRVGLVVYGSRGEVLLEPTGDHEAIRSAIGRLRPGGSTNAEEGLSLAYALARENFRPGRIHRLILCSDGVANVGRTGADSILARVADEAGRGIELTTVGFGMGNYNDVMMEQLADKGDGSYAYVDNLNEARRIFVESLTGVLLTVARDAKVQVEFNPEIVSRYRLLGYENRDVADDRFRDDTVDAGEIGAGHHVTALYEVKLAADAPRRASLATFRIRYQSTATDRVEEFSREVTRRDLVGKWDKAPTSLRLAALVAEFAEILKGAYWAREGNLGDVFRRTQALSAELAGDARVAELAALAGKAAELAGTESGPER